MTKLYYILTAIAITMFMVGIVIGPIGSACKKPKLDKAGIILVLSSLGLILLTALIFAWESVINM